MPQNPVPDGARPLEGTTTVWRRREAGKVDQRPNRLGSSGIFCRSTQDGIEIARVLYGARDLDALVRANL
jgi:hypothetical protein